MACALWVLELAFSTCLGSTAIEWGCCLKSLGTNSLVHNSAVLCLTDRKWQVPGEEGRSRVTSLVAEEGFQAGFGGLSATWVGARAVPCQP